MSERKFNRDKISNEALQQKIKNIPSVDIILTNILSKRLEFILYKPVQPSQFTDILFTFLEKNLLEKCKLFATLTAMNVLILDFT